MSRRRYRRNKPNIRIRMPRADSTADMVGVGIMAFVGYKIYQWWTKPSAPVQP